MIDSQQQEVACTRRLRLRRLQPADLDDLREIMQDPAVMVAYEGPFSDREVEDWLQKQLMRYRQDGIGLWAVTDRESGAFLGQCGLTWQQVGQDRLLEIGYLFKRRFWGHGYATEAAAACRDLAFGALGSRQVCSIIRDSNLASQRVAMRLGMQPARHFTKHYRGVDMPHTVYVLQQPGRDARPEERMGKMEKSKVYFTNLRARPGVNLLDKLRALMVQAGLPGMDLNNKFVAIKIHFGEPGNLAYLRPNYAKVLVDLIKEQGGKPFLTDCNTLYVGRRKNALDHLESAYENGYNPFTVGCHLLIADGLKGTDETLVPIDGEYVKEAKIGRAVMDADVFISLNHFKGHEATGFGGALKNIGMGCGSRAGKMEMHSSGKPWVQEETCIHCGACVKNCAHGAITFPEKKARINHDRCVGCGRCIGVCPVDAVQPASDEANDILNCKIAEYTYAVIKDKPHFHVSLVVDVSPYCDCHAENDLPIVPDVGMFASFDPVALDMACADACNRQPVIPGSILDEKHDHSHHDHFTDTHPETNWMSCIDHAVKLGIGRKEYEIVEVTL